MLKNLSGFSWDSSFGLNIGAQTEEAYRLLEKVIIAILFIAYINYVLAGQPQGQAIQKPWLPSLRCYV